MALKKLGVVGALVMGFIVTPGAANAFSMEIHSTEEFAYRLHQQGVPKRINLSARKDLRSIQKQAQRYAERLDLGCESSQIFEVRLRGESYEWIGGYLARVDCEDAPAPLGMYFDVNQVFLTVFEFGS